jgi:hypothetical protein
MKDEAVIGKLWMPAIAVIILAVVIIMGSATLGGIEKGVRDKTTVLLVPITLQNITQEVLVGSSGTYPYLQSATSCRNGTDLFNTSYYSTREGDVNGGYIRLLNVSAGTGIAYNSTSWQNTKINCTIEYLKANSASGATNVFIAGLIIFGTFIGIVVLALISKLIIGMFKNNF